MKKIERKVSPRPVTPQSRHRDLLLYVEDDDDNWRVVDLRLRDSYEIVRATNARDACLFLQERGSALAAILMDIELRGSDLSGIELTELIRGKRLTCAVPDYAHKTPVLNTPIIFVTAHGAKYSDAHLQLIGADKVIGKPIDFSALSIALTQLHLTRIAQKRRKP
jgi:CheY-like chemotaxis protein